MSFQSGTLRAGYTPLSLSRYAQHTYCNGDDDTYRFGCYGGIEGGTYPASFWEPKAETPAYLGQTATVDMGLARYIAANANPGWDTRQDYTEKLTGWMLLGDCSGLVYGIHGVCHQMSNAILLSTCCSQLSAVVWPPSFTASLQVYGWRGRFFRSTAPIPARLEWLVNSYDGAPVGPFHDAPLETYLNEGIDESSRFQELRGHLPGLAAGLFDLAGYRDPDMRFFALKHELDRLLLQGGISPGGFAEEVNGAFQQRGAAQRDALQGTDFAFLAPGDEIPDLVDPELMASEEAYLRVGENLVK